MKWISTTWPLARDIALTGTGLWIIIMQAIAPAAARSDLLLTVAIALTTPSLASHAVTLLSGQSAPAPGPSPSSSSSSPPGSQLSSSAPDPGREHP